MRADRRWDVIRAAFLAIGVAGYTGVGAGCTGAIGDPARAGQPAEGGGGDMPAASGAGGTAGASAGL